MFSTCPITNSNVCVTSILSSANAFNLELSKILSFGKELNVANMIISVFDRVARKEKMPVTNNVFRTLLPEGH